MSSAPATSITYASVGLLFGKPDPRMMPGFPKDTAFTPYLVLRNTTEKPLDVSLQLNYMPGPRKDRNGGAPVRRNLPAQHLAPFEARQVDMQPTLNSAGLASFNGSINLSTTLTGKGGDLVLASGSVDQTGTYVFEVDPQGVGSSRSKYTNYWSVANGNDTMLSLFNPTNAAQDILATFYYGDGSGKYTLPVHLEPQASTMIDMATLIAEHQPDADGNVIPPSVQEGSAQFASATGRREWITLVIVGGIYNVANATCGSSCITCCGVSNFGISPNPILCPIGVASQCGSTAVDCNGYSVSPSSWGSSNTAVMTVNSSGLVTGVSVGSATITAYFNNVPTYTGQICGGNPVCPRGSPAPQAPATIKLTILLGGPNGTDITNTTQSVVTGQQIVLYGNYGPSTIVESQSWSIPGTIVAGYTASNSSGSLNTTVNLTQQSPTFYWVFAGNSQTVTFTLQYVNSQTSQVQTATAQATFNVTAPSPATPTVTLPANGNLYIDTLTGCTSNPSGPNLVFGNISGPVPGCPGSYTGSPGIAFSPPSTSTPAGTFFFVQLINGDTVKYNSLTCTATNTPGLDGAYPYQNKTGQPVNDAPFSPLPSTYSTSSRTFNATMYLMWQSSTQNSIPVPMGSVPWQFSGSTTQSGGTWSTPSGSGSAQAFIAASGTSSFPTWTGVVGNASNNCH